MNSLAGFDLFRINLKKKETLLPVRRTIDVFAENFKRLLEARHLRVEDAAKEIGVSKATVYAWLNADAWPNHKYIDKIVDLLKIPAAELLIDEYEVAKHMLRYKEAFGTGELRTKLIRHSLELQNLLETLKETITDENALESFPQDRDHDFEDF